MGLLGKVKEQIRELCGYSQGRVESLCLSAAPVPKLVGPPSSEHLPSSTCHHRPIQGLDNLSVLPTMRNQKD